MIGKGCTCVNTFTLPFAKEEVKAICIVYCQDSEILVKKELGDCSFANGNVEVNLTQEDTLKFDSSKFIKIQIKVKLQSDVVMKSNIIKTNTDEVLCYEVI